MFSTQTRHGAPRGAGPAGEEPLRRAEEGVAHHSGGGPAAINRRLEQLDRKAEAGAGDPPAGVALGVALGAALGALLGPRLRLLPAAAGATLLLRAALRGRPRGAPAAAEERCALKALRGDFRDLPALATAEDRADAARFEGEGGTARGPEGDDPLDRQDRAAVAAALQAARR
jgi:hypothetical protein